MWDVRLYESKLSLIFCYCRIDLPHRLSNPFHQAVSELAVSERILLGYSLDRVLFSCH